MRLAPVLAFCLLIPNLLSREVRQTSSSPPRTPYIEREEKQFSFFPGGKIEITAGVAGSLKIIGWQKGSVRMEAEKISYYASSSEQAKTDMGQSRIRVRWNQTSAMIRTSGDPAAKLEINLTVYVPRDKTDIIARVHHGDFSIEGINGWVEATVMTEGSLEARSMSGYFSGSTLRGDVSVEMAGNRWRGLEFAAVTQHGSANLQIPVEYSAALQLETREGKIVVDYPPQVVEGEVVPPEIVINGNSQSLKASVGDGGAPIKLVTYYGDVMLSEIR